MDKTRDPSNARSEARAELRCREVIEDIVALQRDELSPLRAESVRQHLSSCPECREEALGLELAVRDFARLPELVPPPDLVDITMRRVIGSEEASGPAKRREAAAPARAEPAPAPAPALTPAQRERLPGVLRRPVRNPFVRVAVAAFLFIAVVFLGSERVAEAAGRAQQKLLGARASEKIDEARDAFLEKLRM